MESEIILLRTRTVAIYAVTAVVLIYYYALDTGRIYSNCSAPSSLFTSLGISERVEIDFIGVVPEFFLFWLILTIPSLLVVLCSRVRTHDRCSWVFDIIFGPHMISPHAHQHIEPLSPDPTSYVSFGSLHHLLLKML